MGRVTWRGVVLDERTAAMMAQVAANTPADLWVKPSQGSYSGGVAASAGTHNGGGAIDCAAAQLTPKQRDVLVREMRRVGFAAWLRTPQQSNWPYHIHGIAIGCPDLSPAAAAQVRDYHAGRNGLAAHRPDDGPRDFVHVTWETYQKENVMPLTDDDIQRIAKAVRREVWGSKDKRSGGKSMRALLREVWQATGGTPTDPAPGEEPRS